MNFKFKNLLGAPFRGGNLLISNNTHLLSPVGNRISITDLVKSETVTLPCENAKNVSKIALSPSGALLLSVDEDGKSILINLRRRVVLHHFSFKGPVSALKFSPDGTLIAAGVGRLIQIWRTPGFKKEFAPFELVRTFASCHDTVTCVDWSPDSQWVIAGSKDLTARLFCIYKLEDDNPVALMGHRDVINGVFLKVESSGNNKGKVVGAYTVARDGVLYSWKFNMLEKYRDPLMYENSTSHLSLVATTEAKFAPGNRPIAPPPRDNADKEDQEPDFVVNLNSPSTKQPSQTTPADKTATVNGKNKRKRGKTYESMQSQAGSELDEGDNIHESTSGRQAGVASVAPPEKTGIAVWRLDRGRWELKNKHFFKQNAKLTSCDYHQSLDLVLAGFASGVFGLYQMPDFTCIHLLSISRERLTTSIFNGTGNWLAFGCAKLGQLLIWEWRSESYILKQQGHYFDVNSVAYSPDSQLIATGADDNKLKVWNVSSGFCFVTFAEHSNAVTSVHILPGNNVVLSASLDGTVRAWDLVRYRNFRTFITPSPTQFVSLAADQSGEVVCAGSLDSFQIYVWSMKTGRLLDILSGHKGPVHGLTFSPVHVLLRRFQITRNRSIDGVLDFLNSKGMTDAGPIDLVDDDESDGDEGQEWGQLGFDLPGTTANAGRPIAQTKCLHLSPTGRSWVAATTEGVLLYSMDNDLVFDPTDLDLDVTPQAISTALNDRQYTRALVLALRLNESRHIRDCVESVPPSDVATVASSIPLSHLGKLLECIAEIFATSPHLEFMLCWCQELCCTHGCTIQLHNKELLPPLRALQKAVTRLHEDLASCCSNNHYLLQYLCSAPNSKISSLDTSHTEGKTFLQSEQ